MSVESSSRVKQGGAIGFRVHEHGLVQVLVVRPSTGDKEWVFPKGHLEPPEALYECALRELAEEAGVIGLVIGAVDHISEFESKGEPVAVRYFVCECLEERPPAERREHAWLPLTLAAEMMTHHDNRVVLSEAVSIIDGYLAASGRGDSQFREFLRLELAHLTDSFFKSEEDGERRVKFFLSLTVGAGALMAFLLGQKEYKTDTIYWPVMMIVGGLLVFGYFVLVRMIRRNDTTDRYKENLRRMRRWFTPNEADPRTYWVAFNPHDPLEERKPPSFRKPVTGGWIEILLLVNAILAAAFVAAAVPAPEWYLEAAAAIAGGFLAWLLLIHRTRRMMKKLAAERKEYRTTNDRHRNERMARRRMD